MTFSFILCDKYRFSTIMSRLFRFVIQRRLGQASPSDLNSILIQFGHLKRWEYMIWNWMGWNHYPCPVMTVFTSHLILYRSSFVFHKLFRINLAPTSHLLANGSSGLQLKIYKIVSTYFHLYFILKCTLIWLIIYLRMNT